MPYNKSFPATSDSQVVAISIGSATTTAVVAGVAGKTVRVLMLVLAGGSTASAMTVQLAHGATNWTGAMSIAAGQGFAVDHHDMPLVTAAGEAFNIVTAGTTVSVAGYCLYTQS